MQTTVKPDTKLKAVVAMVWALKPGDELLLKRDKAYVTKAVSAIRFWGAREDVKSKGEDGAMVIYVPLLQISGTGIPADEVKAETPPKARRSRSSKQEGAAS